ncbi:MAG TPA: hypothetical protein P5080_05540 [Candidatus Paceibacterota bacterium]|nr:hypothetical protein [Candidatus Pacearchaeota archaeon]HRZ51409.1 hypothetical protein [Candidatus Paceibacterota bacterium]HSA37131.1 hypothetical protein [Candidatus Paceibacterota bacterium]
MEIFINGASVKAEIDFSHPDHFWLIRDESDGATWTNVSGMANAFLTQEEAEIFIAKEKFEEKAVAKCFSWHDLPHVLGPYFQALIVKNPIESSSYRIFPLDTKLIK